MDAAAIEASSELGAGARLAALGGLLGPAAFISAWLVAGAITDLTYSPISETISRLAAVTADTRAPMVAGLIAFGVFVPAYGWSLRRVIGGGAPLTAAITGFASFGIAATPLDHSTAVDALHRGFAVVGYVSLVLTPLLAAGPLEAAGYRRLARAARICGWFSAVCLVASLAPIADGLFQRLGLTATDLWLAASGVAIATGQVGPSSRRGRPGGHSLEPAPGTPPG